VDELEEKSAQNELSLKSLKDFYAKVQKLSGDKLPKLPDIALNPNVNDLLHPNDTGLFDNRQHQFIGAHQRQSQEFAQQKPP
jgi:hypothetical protein